MTALVQISYPKKLSLGMLRDSRARLSNTAGQGIHLNDKSCDDDADAFPVLLSVSVKREASAPASEQFDAGNSVDVNVLNRDGLDGRRHEKQAFHCWPPFVTREFYGKKISDEKGGTLSFSIARKSQRAFSLNFNFAALASFPSAFIEKHPPLVEPEQQGPRADEREAHTKFKSEFQPHSIRERSAPSPCAPIARGVRSPGVSGAYSQIPPERRSRLRRQLAGSANAPCFFFKRAFPLRNYFENTPCNRAKQSWRMISALHFRASPHADQFGMGVVQNAAQVVQGENRV